MIPPFFLSSFLRCINFLLVFFIIVLLSSNLVKLIKGLTVTVASTRSFNEAIITQGGVNVKDVNPGTMESKLVEDLYFVGEVLDVDALTGGYNLQVAWSTGYLAGISVR